MTMDKGERAAVHGLELPDGYAPDPPAHLNNPRDRLHFQWTRDSLRALDCHSVLDIGSWDGWLDFLLIAEGFHVDGVELVPALAEAAQRYAKAMGLPYHVMNGFFDEVEVPAGYDAALAYEVLEHVSLDSLPAYLKKAEAVAANVFITLPNQRHEDNPQHLWTPTEALIRGMFGSKPGFELEYKIFGAGIVDNWFIRYRSPFMEP